jgi:hypothetical protein
MRKLGPAARTRTGRNDPCPCGSTYPNGRRVKYKRCCLKTREDGRANRMEFVHSLDSFLATHKRGK